MALKIARLVFTLAIRLVRGFVLYSCTGSPCASKMGVDVGHMYHEPGAGHVGYLW
jgi:hypothetical protein